MPIVTLTGLQSADDARQAASSVSTTATTFNTSGGNVWGGFRFPNCPVAPGSVINSAIFRIRLTGAGPHSMDVNLFFQAHDNAPVFTTSNNDISSRSRTSANVPWTFADVATGFRDSPNIAAPLAEVIARGGWFQYQAVALILDSNSVASASFRTFDYGTTVPELIIDYTPPAGGLAQIMSYIRRKTI